MICGSAKVRTDGKRRWRHKTSHSRHQPRNWKVMLWLMAALLALAEDVLSEEDGPENQLKPHRHVLGRPPWRPSAPETRDHIASLWPEALEAWTPLQDADAARSRWRRSPRDGKAPTSRRKPKRPKGSASCRVEKRQTRVRELGLGYDSDEIVLFKYCVGSCRPARRNYDLALGALAARGAISARKVSGRPCCRPTRYETVSFMDARAMWQTIRWLSAADCGCVG
ncbi:neurturin [Hippocampus comes]|nr:PREDICTED: artemin [Hippocampus comes]